MSKFFDFFKSDTASGPGAIKCRTWVFAFGPLSVMDNGEKTITFDFWMSGSQMMHRLMTRSYIGGDTDDGPFIIATSGVKEVRGVVEEDRSLTASEVTAKNDA